MNYPPARNPLKERAVILKTSPTFGPVWGDLQALLGSVIPQTSQPPLSWCCPPPTWSQSCLSIVIASIDRKAYILASREVSFKAKTFLLVRTKDFKDDLSLLSLNNECLLTFLKMRGTRYCVRPIFTGIINLIWPTDELIIVTTSHSEPHNYKVLPHPWSHWLLTISLTEGKAGNIIPHFAGQELRHSATLPCWIWWRLSLGGTEGLTLREEHVKVLVESVAGSSVSPEGRTLEKGTRVRLGFMKYWRGKRNYSGGHIACGEPYMRGFLVCFLNPLHSPKLTPIPPIQGAILSYPPPRNHRNNISRFSHASAHYNIMTRFWGRQCHPFSK